MTHDIKTLVVKTLIRNRNNKWSKENVLTFKERWKAVTIPVNIKIDTRQTALQLDQVLSIVRSAEKISVENCFCRTDLQNCDYPRKVCLSFNELASKNVNDGIAEFISTTEAEKIILEAHQEGLVPMALHRPEEDEKNIQAVCNCCSCCCSAFQGLLRLNMTGLVKRSQYVSTHDPGKCHDCGECTYHCHFKARTLGEGGEMTFNQAYCFGCGLCVTRCPEEANTMIERVSS
ncbi:MAG: ATP-binding protein [Candidatus Hodarchaeales archaeon]|jgi:Pyruvate/2-oxoacid:ferredoxin oxidoreductase delta subunit